MGKTFGEFKDYMELNQAAEGLFQEGDLDNLKKLAEENGIPEELVNTYDGTMLCDAQTAAVGALEVELKKLAGQKNALGQLVVNYLSGLCEKEKNALVVFQSAGRLKDFVDKTFDEARKKATGGSFWMSDDDIRGEARRVFIRGKEPWKKQK